MKQQEMNEFAHKLDDFLFKFDEVEWRKEVERRLLNLEHELFALKLRCAHCKYRRDAI